MARKNVTKVFKSWVGMQSAKGPKGSVSTDGTTIFSYRMPLAVRTGPKTAIVSNSSPSVTTSCHLGGVRYLLAMEGYTVTQVSREEVEAAHDEAQRQRLAA